MKCATCSTVHEPHSPCPNCMAKAQGSTQGASRVAVALVLIVVGIILIVVLVNRYEVVGMSSAGAVKLDRVTGETAVIQGQTEYPVQKADPVTTSPPVERAPVPQFKPKPPVTPKRVEPVAKPALEPQPIRNDEIKVAKFSWRPVADVLSGDRDDSLARIDKKNYWVEFSLNNTTELDASSVAVRVTFWDSNGDVIQTVDLAAVAPKKPYESTKAGQIPTSLPARQTKFVKAAVFSPTSSKKAGAAVVRVVTAE